MREFINQFLMNVLFFFGFLPSDFQFVDPMAAFVLFIFSTHILSLILAVLIWIFVYSKNQHYKGGADFGGLTRSSSADLKSHSYHSKDVFRSEGGGFIFGFVLPIVALFVGIYILLWFIRDYLKFF